MTDAMTPAGLQPRATLFRRRVVVAVLNLVTMAVLTWGIATIFGGDGWTAADIVILVAFLIGTPWTVMGLWNAVIGLWLLHGPKDALLRAAPHLAAPDAPVTARTAILMFLRNEDPARALARLLEVRRSIDATGQGGLFDVYVLSDTSEPTVAREEEAAFESIRPLLGPGAVYRRREKNEGYKAGNVRDWLLRWGQDYTFYLPLDSDSLMAGPTVLRMVRIMEVYPKIGILQSLVVGTPSESAFARIFQFGMRHGMRSFTMGAAWWHGDCGPYWGHNAIIRTQPFRDDCHLPTLPGSGPLGGYVLSHDQLEAALMRRAGFEVRVIPVEGASWEDNPVTLLDFTKRDLRWCQGNMQYWRFLPTPGLMPMSRFQVFAAIAMYFGAPAWMAMTVAGAWKMIAGEGMDVNFALGVSMFFIMIAVSLFPKIAGWIDIALRPGGVRAYGGAGRFVAGALVETVFSVLISPVVALRVTLFLIGLLFGKRVVWGGQVRDAYSLRWSEAARGLWPQTAMGLGLLWLIEARAPGALVWAAPILAGLGLAIPFAVLTASPAVGRLCTRLRLCAIPEEFAPHEALRALDGRLPALPQPAPLAAE